LGPHRQHHVAEDKGIQGDEGDVAAEVEGEHAADEEEEHAAGFLIHWFSQPSSSFGAALRQSLTCIAPDASPFGPTSGCSSFSPPRLPVLDLPQGLDSPFEVLPGEDRDPERHQERRREHAEEWPEIHHPLPFAREGRRLLPQADHSRRDRPIS
jgi:hypothetical protein